MNEKFKDEKLVWVGVYADTTGLFSDGECDYDNWVDLEFPESIVRLWYEENGLAEETAHELSIPVKEATFERWLNDVSYGEDTDGLYEFAEKHGYHATCGIDTPCYIFSDGHPETVLFRGTCNECREYGKKCGWVNKDEEGDEWELVIQVDSTKEEG